MQGRDSHPADNSLAAFQSRPFFVIPLEHSGREISPFLKEFLGHKKFTELPIDYTSWVTDDSLSLTMT